jgi:hypothetical protein
VLDLGEKKNIDVTEITVDKAIAAHPENKGLFKNGCLSIRKE